MRALVRIVLAWVVAMALPVQGFAAAAMLSCGPGHARMAEAVDAGHSHEFRHGAHPRLDAHAVAGVHSLAEVAVPDKASPDASAASAASGAFTCSACAACCVASALPASPRVVVALRSVSEPIPEQRQPGGDFVVERLEHPPKALIA